MKEEEAWTLKDAVRLYYGETKLSEEESRQVDEILLSMEKSGLKEKCQKIALEKEKKIWHIGKLCLNRVACIIFVACIFLISTGFAAYMGYIRKIDVVDKGNHSEVDYTYNEGGDSVKLSSIEDYYKPTWVPAGYRICSEYKNRHDYNANYISEDDRNNIVYNQTLPFINVHFSSEGGIKDDISFGKYNENCHIITYLYFMPTNKILLKFFNINQIYYRKLHSRCVFLDYTNDQYNLNIGVPEQRKRRIFPDYFPNL